MAEKLAIQVKQNSEELAYLTRIFSQNNKSLLMESDEVKNSCKLEPLKKLESSCSGKALTKIQKLKLETLKKQFNTSDSSASKKTLFSAFASKFVADFGAIDTSGKICPISELSGDFQLLSQLSEHRKGELIETLKLPSPNANHFQYFPQAKLIYNTNDQKLIALFKSYISSLGKDNLTSESILTFMSRSENQSLIAKSLAKQCNHIMSNVNTFICNDLEELSTNNEDLSEEFFNLINDSDIAEQFLHITDEALRRKYIAYGYRCLLEEKSKKKSTPLSNNTLDNWNSQFTYNTRFVDDKKTTKSNIESFCQKYLCKDSLVEHAPSCIRGGPINSHDLYNNFECDKKSDKCGGIVQREISYLRNLEKMQMQMSNSSLATVEQNGVKITRPNISKGIPDFAKNFLGEEGTLIALGKPVTYQNFKSMEKDFIESGLPTHYPQNTSGSGNGGGSGGTANPSTPGNIGSISSQAHTMSPNGMIIPGVKPQNLNPINSLQQAQTSAAISAQNSASNNAATVSVSALPAESRTPSNVSAQTSATSKPLVSPPVNNKQSAGDEKEIENIRKRLEQLISDKNEMMDKRYEGTTPPGAMIADGKRLNSIQTKIKAEEKKLQDIITERRRIQAENNAISPKRNTSPTAATTRELAAEETAAKSITTTSTASSAPALKQTAPTMSSSNEGTIASDNTTKGSSQAKQEKNISRPPEDAITLDILNKIDPDKFNQTGVNGTFVIKIKIDNTIDPIRVIVVESEFKGKKVFKPIIDSSASSEIRDKILQAPLFSRI